MPPIDASEWRWEPMPVSVVQRVWRVWTWIFPPRTNADILSEITPLSENGQTMRDITIGRHNDRYR